MTKNIVLIGKKILNGEYIVAIRVIIKIKRIPSWKSFILLFPFLLCTTIGTYFTVLPVLKYAKVLVEGYEKVFGKRDRYFKIVLRLNTLKPDVRSSI